MGLHRHEQITKGNRLCSTCLSIKPSTEFFTIWKRTKTTLYPICKTCCSQQNKDRNKLNSGTKEWNRRTRLYHLKNQYGITEQQYEEMMKRQGGVCAICGKEDNPLCIDHCRTSGVVRGLLCRGCNLGIGHFEENRLILNWAIQYLDQHLN